MLDAAAALLHAVLAFDRPMEAVLADAVRGGGAAGGDRPGSRDRRLLGDVAYAAVRRLGWFRHVVAVLDAVSADGSSGVDTDTGTGTGTDIDAGPAFDPTAGERVAGAVRGTGAVGVPGAVPGRPRRDAAFARRLASLAWPVAQRGDLDAMLRPDERAWLVRADALQAALDRASLPDEARFNLPDWIVERLRPGLGDAGLAAFAAAARHPAPVDLRVNRQKATRDEVRVALAAAGVAAEPTPFSPVGLRLPAPVDLSRHAVLADGRAEIQDEGSQLLALALGARRGETVVDFCAGAGGKTLALGAQMRGTGRVLAFDVSGGRLAALAPRLVASGLANVHTAAIPWSGRGGPADARVERLVGKADRVLVDAPCTGLGTLRRHPDLAWRQTPTALAALVRSQGEILAAAARLVKPGGTLAYATCSVLPDENEAVVAAFERDAGPAFVRASPRDALERSGVEQAAALVEGDDLVLRTERHGTDGFRAAFWRRA